MSPLKIWSSYVYDMHQSALRFLISLCFVIDMAQRFPSKMCCFRPKLWPKTWEWSCATLWQFNDFGEIYEEKGAETVADKLEHLVTLVLSLTTATVPKHNQKMVQTTLHSLSLNPSSTRYGQSCIPTPFWQYFHPRFRIPRCPMPSPKPNQHFTACAGVLTVGMPGSQRRWRCVCVLIEALYETDQKSWLFCWATLQLCAL